MSRLQESFEKLQGIKKEQKNLKASYKEALGQTPEHKNVTEELKKLRDKKKRIEEGVKADFGQEFTRLDKLKIELESEKELMSDLALNKLTSGEKVEITDQYENQYEPVFSVKFQKIG